MTQTAEATPATDADIALFSTTATWQGKCRTDVKARDFDIPVSEPEELGGDDSAPNPMEVLLAGLDGCLAVVIETVAAEWEAEVKSVEFTTEGSLDTRGFLGTAEVNPYFQHVYTRVDIDTNIPADQFDEFTATVLRRCPAATLIIAADVDFKLEWQRV